MSPGFTIQVPPFDYLVSAARSKVRGMNRQNDLRENRRLPETDQNPIGLAETEGGIVHLMEPKISKRRLEDSKSRFVGEKPVVLLITPASPIRQQGMR
jgi:hypothetical protein